MIYLYIGKNTIKLVCLTKTLLGQYNLSFFEKKHSVALLEDGQIQNIDLVASAVKEAITGAAPTEIKDRDIYLILPQESFSFARYSVPADIQESAIVPFIKDKARASLPFELDSSLYDFMVLRMQTESAVQFFALKNEHFDLFGQVFTLLGLNLTAVVPETAGYFKLFEKTLKKDKKEQVIVAKYDDGAPLAFVYDSLGLVSEERIELGEDIKKSLKKQADEMKEKAMKPDRLILSGEESKTVRQDLFTKDVGEWTNPLEKIVTNFYQEYLKLLVSPEKSVLPFLTFDVCLGGFILATENPNFSLLGKNGRKVKKMSASKPMSLPSMSISKRDVFMFVTSFIVSFLIIYFGPKVLSSFTNTSRESKPITLAPTAGPKESEPTVAPTPNFKKEELKIKILNGSGTVGKATEVKDILKEAGYVDILTGNADNFDYTVTEIQIKKDKKAAFELLKNDLKKNISLKTPTILDEDDAADVILIIGTDFE